MRHLQAQRAIAVIGLFALLMLLSTPPRSQASVTTMCFAETQQCIFDAVMRDYWLKNGGLPVFGYPTTGPHGRADAQGTYITSQWFQRNRLELHPENAAPYNVLLGRLGDELLHQSGRDAATMPKANPTAAHYFDVTGHAIAAAFWGSWSSHGLDLGDPDISQRESLALFGYPITEPQNEPAANGEMLLTQWFERARFEYHPNNDVANRVQLGLLGNEMNPLSPQRALERANRYRAYAGVPALQLHPAMVNAAQNHANYFLQNHANPAAQTAGPHGEVAGFPGFTGKWPTDRVKAAGFPYYGGAEVMHFSGDPNDSVDDWIATIYHRAILIDPNAYYTGYGAASRYDSSSQQQVAVDVMDFAQGPPPSPADPYPLAYPADRQGDVLTYWGGGESPDPLPAGAARPVGFPFSIHGVNGLLRVDFAEMRDAGGQAVAVHPNPPDCKDSCYALIPISPLRPNTSYGVHIRGAVGNAPFDRTWQFSTGNYQTPKLALVRWQSGAKRDSPPPHVGHQSSIASMMLQAIASLAYFALDVLPGLPYNITQQPSFV